MSWSMPPSGPWNPGVPPVASGDLGGYTPEQWAVMQQQNWLQWSQWQQQYAQWQNEYGEKYAQQMQALQAMGGMPPLPTNTAPPAPPPGPPPEQPPPPPPHENNQPLYEQKQNQPIPVPPPQSQQNHTTNVQDVHNRPDTAVASVNSEALKKLAEEERLFDIQFKKWEEEIDKWRKENVNHPDKQAYFDYEQKFEACRVQLLERRQQMKQKRARLLSNTPQTGNMSETVKISTAVPPPLEKPTSQNYPLQNYTTKPPPPQMERNQNMQYQQQSNKNLQYDHSNNMPYQQSRNSEFQKPNEQFQQPRNHSRFEQTNNNQQLENTPYRNSNDSHFQQTKNNHGQHQSGFGWKNDENSNQNSDFGFDNDAENLDQDSQSGYDMNIDENYVDENYESYQNVDDDYSTNSNFLPTSASSKGIPGLDLVPDDKPKTAPQEVIDITDDPDAEKNIPKHSQSQIPDYSKISKGINNILGDEKIMNILTMVRDQNIPFKNDDTENTNTQYFGANNIRSNQLNTQWKDDTHNNQQLEKRHMAQNRPPPAHVAFQTDWQQNSQRELNPPRAQDPEWQEHRQWEQNSERELNSQWEQNPQWGKNPHWEKNPQWEPNSNWEANRQWQQNSQWEQNKDYPQNQMQNNRQNNISQEQNYDRNPQNMGQNMPPRQTPPSGGPIRSLMQDIRPTLQPGGPIRPLMQNIRPTSSPGGPIRPLMQDMRPTPPPGGSIRPLMQDISPIPPQGGPNRPPLQDMSAQQNMFSRESQENKGFDESNVNHPPKPKWIEVPLFNPSIIVEYDHQSLRLKARDFIEPVHMFDYNHKSKDDEYKKVDFEREADDLFSRKPRRPENDDSRLASGWSGRDLLPKDFERRIPRDDFRDEGRSRMVQRDSENRYRDFDNRSRDYENRAWEYEERRRPDDKYDERRRDERDKFSWRDDIFRTRDRERDRGDRERDRGNREKERDRVDRDRDLTRDRDFTRDRDLTRDRGLDYKRDDSRNRSISNERDLRKRGISKETDVSDKSAPKKTKGNESPKLTPKAEEPKHIVMVDDILESPGRDMRPQKIVIILRGPPGSGKSYLAKLIRDREAQFGGTVRIMSIDDYFMQEGEVEEKDPVTGKMVKKPSLKYEFEDSLEETYITSLKRAFKRTITDGYFTFLIYDAVNDQLKSYADIWNFARQNGFQVYICTMEIDAQTCFKRNIHGRSLDDIQIICSRFFPTPAHHIQLDPTTLLQSASITEVQMEDASDEVIMDDVQVIEVENTSKWEKMDDETQLARLDGTSKPLRPSQLSMEDYLQLDDWKPTTAKPGKKTVRWADIEERREQEKMRAIGFVVGQTDWNRMTDPTLGSSALTQTKYIERVKHF